MIKSFRRTELIKFFLDNDPGGIRADLVQRCRSRLTALDNAAQPQDMNIPGFNFHRLRGKPIRYSVHVNGPWAITFEFCKGNALRVDLEQYH